MHREVQRASDLIGAPHEGLDAFIALTDDRVRSEAVATCSGLIEAKVG